MHYRAAAPHALPSRQKAVRAAATAFTVTAAVAIEAAALKKTHSCFLFS